MGLRENLLHEPVSRLDVAPGILAPPDLPVRDAVRLMRERDEGCVVVVDEQGRPQGKFTEHQLADLLANRPGAMEDAVSRHMRRAWAVMNQNDPIVTLIHKLQDYRLRWVIVVDDQGKALGVIGQHALMAHLAERFPRAVKVQPMDDNMAIQAREGA